MEELKAEDISQSTVLSRTDVCEGQLPHIFFHAPRDDRSEIHFDPTLHDRAVLKELFDQEWEASRIYIWPVLFILAGAFFTDGWIGNSHWPFPLLFFETLFGALSLMVILAVLSWFIWTTSRIGQPNCITFLDTGLELKNLEVKSASRFIYWSQIVRAYISKSENGRIGPLQLELYPESSRQVPQPVLLPLAAFGPKNLEKLLSGLKRHLTPEHVDESILAELRRLHAKAESKIVSYPAATAASEPSYTSLWLSVLQNSRARVKSSVLEAGAKLQEGSYVIVSKLGVGGQGTVYLANAYVPEEPYARVALKEFILPAHAGEEAVRRVALEVEREASLLSRLKHPQIVRMIDSFVEDWRIYLVQEYLEGNSLQNVVARDGHLDITPAIQFGIQMCDVLDYLHTQSPPVVHRDFTPPNLMLCMDGKLRLIDFNVAFQAEFNSGKTIVGKRNYIPPEQFRGQACAASDIYALGGTLYFILTGRDPEPLSQSLPAKARPEIDQVLNQIVAKATALEAQERYATVKELAQDLERLKLAKEARATTFPSC